MHILLNVSASFFCRIDAHMLFQHDVDNSNCVQH